MTSPLVQGHIHISSTLSGSPEFSPDMKWIIHDRKEIPVVFINPRRSKRAKLFPNVLNTTGTPIQLCNFEYQIRVRDDGVNDVWTNKEALKAMNGKIVYAVDTYHCPDGSDHSAYVHQYLFNIGDQGFGVDQWALAFYFVNVSLTDASI